MFISNKKTFFSSSSRMNKDVDLVFGKIFYNNRNHFHQAKDY